MNIKVGHDVRVHGLLPSRLGTLCILSALVGVALRIWLAVSHPVIPFSDFKRIVDFAVDLAAHGLFVQVWHWSLLNAGSSTVLSLPLAILPGDPTAIARAVTVLAMCAVPLIPLFMLRGVIADSARLLTVSLIALQPGLIVFSGVVAQDNWVQVPVTVLACLAVRATIKGRTSPCVAAILWALSVFMRQEMLLVMAPLALAASWPSGRPSKRWANVATLLLMMGVLLTLIAGQRYMATGQFRITSEHGSTTVLGAFIPGAGFGWIPYESYVATIDPKLADDPELLAARSGELVRGEIARRPAFHAQRRLGGLLYSTLGVDGSLTYWSLSEDAQSVGRRASAAALANWISPWIVAGLILVHALFIAIIPIAWRTRDKALIALVAVIIVKAALHLLFPPQVRFFLVLVPLEAIAIGYAWSLTHQGGMRMGKPIAIAGLVAMGFTGCAFVLPKWHAAVMRADPAVAPSWATLRSKYGTTRCALTAGNLIDMTASSLVIVTKHADPEWGESAEVVCRMTPTGDQGGLRLEVEDPYAPGGFPDRMRQVVSIDSRIVLRHDIAAAPGSGWWTHDLPRDRVEFRVKVEAVRPDAGPGWGNAARTRIRLVETP